VSLAGLTGRNAFRTKTAAFATKLPPGLLVARRIGK
jgi:hypothetical protein